MTGIIKLLRSITPGSRPSSRTYGEGYFNFGDNQFGGFNSSNAPIDLVGVPYFSSAATYAAGAPVNNGGKFYTANIAISAGAFNSANWTQLTNPFPSPLSFLGQCTAPLATLTDGATISWSVALAQKAKVTLAGNRTMAAVTGAIEGTTYFLWVIQDATGSRTLAWTTSGAGAFDFGAAGAPTLTTTASRADLLTFESIIVASTLKLRYTGIAKGFA
jgi:hypothetical protein